MSAVEKMPAKQEPAAVGAITPPVILERAFATGNLELVSQAMTLVERWETNQNRKAFDEAVSAVKAKIPPIEKNRTGHNNKRYADLAAIATAVDPVIEAHGLSYRFRTKQDDKTIHVTCILSHRAGHREENTLAGPADSSGNKNAIQSIGSTLTYLQRYTLMQALGLAAAEDDDGKAAGNGPITKKQAEELQSLIVETGADIPRFKKYFKIEEIDQLPAKDFDGAKIALESKKVKGK